MTSTSIRTRRLFAGAAAAVAAATIAVPVAAAGPDDQLLRHGMRVADAGDASTMTDALDRYVAGRNRSPQFTPDALDRYVAANAHRLAGTRLAGYDSLRVGSPLADSRPTGRGVDIDWASVGLGAGGGLALALLAASALAAARSHRRVVRS